MSNNESTREDWLGALACPGARRIFGRIIYNSTHGRSHCPSDSLATAYNEGRRAVGLEIMQQIEQAKEGETAVLLAETLKEIHHERRKQSNPERDRDGFARAEPWTHAGGQ
jgi:hypothetical protein